MESDFCICRLPCYVEGLLNWQEESPIQYECRIAILVICLLSRDNICHSPSNGSTGQPIEQAQWLSILAYLYQYATMLWASSEGIQVVVVFAECEAPLFMTTSSPLYGRRLP
jgi:hypothetical protein